MNLESFEQPVHAESIEHVRQERDFYRQLLELGDVRDLHDLLQSALGLVVTVTGAGKGYLAVQGEGTDEWWRARGLGEEEVETIRRETSSGIFAKALAAGRTTHHAPAERPAVLCAPVGEQPLGVLYLQGARHGAPLGPRAHRLVEHCCQHLAPLADRLIPRAVTYAQATRQFQKRLLLDTLEQTRWNVSEAARRLGLARSHVYNLLEAFGIRREG